MGNRVDVSSGLPTKAGQKIKVHLPNGFAGQVDFKDCFAERVFGTVHIWAPGTRKMGGKKGNPDAGYELKSYPHPGVVTGLGVFSRGSHKWTDTPGGKPIIGYLPGDE